MKNLLLTLLLAAPLHATTILVDFGSNSTAATGWNNFSNSSTSIALNDSTGAPTPYSLSLTGASTLNGIADNPTSVISTTPSPFNVTSVISDIVFASSTYTLALSGLDPSITYDLTFYSYVNRGDSRRSNFTIAGHTPLSLEAANTSAGGRGETGTITAVTPNSEGIINVTLTSPISNNWILNGLEVTYTIPEPSTALLASLALIPLLRRKRSAGFSRPLSRSPELQSAS